MAILELSDARVHASGRVGDIDTMPSRTLVVGDGKGGRVAGKTGGAVGAQPQAVDPAPVGEDLDGLAGKGALLGKHNLGLAPGKAVIGRNLLLHDRGVLHVVLTRLATAL